jgi:hypothetical protein
MSMVTIRITHGKYDRQVVADAFRAIKDSEYVGHYDGRHHFEGRNFSFEYSGTYDGKPKWDTVYNFELTYKNFSMSVRDIDMSLSFLKGSRDIYDLDDSWGGWDYKVFGSSGDEKFVTDVF